MWRCLLKFLLTTNEVMFCYVFDHPFVHCFFTFLILILYIVLLRFWSSFCKLFCYVFDHHFVHCFVTFLIIILYIVLLRFWSSFRTLFCYDFDNHFVHCFVTFLIIILYIVLFKSYFALEPWCTIKWNTNEMQMKYKLNTN